jgi:hypothetical protein
MMKAGFTDPFDKGPGLFGQFRGPVRGAGIDDDQLNPTLVRLLSDLFETLPKDPATVTGGDDNADPVLHGWAALSWKNLPDP